MAGDTQPLNLSPEARRANAEAMIQEIIAQALEEDGEVLTREGIIDVYIVFAKLDPSKADKEERESISHAQTVLNDLGISWEDEEY